MMSDWWDKWYGHLERNGRSYSWDKCYSTFTDEKIEEQHATAMTKEQFYDCFNWREYWSPIHEIQSNKKYRPEGEPWWSHSERPWYPIYGDGNLRIVVFDIGRTTDEQIVRVLDHPTWYNKDEMHARECGRHIINTLTGEIKSLEFPDSRSNPPYAYRPWFYDEPVKYKGVKMGYSVGGYNGVVNYAHLHENLFYFRGLANRVKPVKVLKKLFLETFIDVDHPIDKWGKYPMIIIKPSLELKLLVQGDLVEQTWRKCPALRRIISYNWQSCGNLDHRKEGIFDSLVGRYSNSYRVALRHGIEKQLVDMESLELYQDLLKTAESLDLDMRNPRFVAPKDIRAEHDRLVDIFNRRERKRLEAEERMRLIREREDEERRAIAEKELRETNDAVYKEAHKDWLGKSWEDDSFLVKPLQDISDFAMTGIEMSNCVYSAGYYRHKDALIVKVIDKSLGKMIEVAELSIPDLKIMQCHGHRNMDSGRHNEIVKFLEKISA